MRQVKEPAARGGHCLSPSCSPEAGRTGHTRAVSGTFRSTEGLPLRVGVLGRARGGRKPPHTLEKWVKGQGSQDVPSQQQLWRWDLGRCSRSPGALRMPGASLVAPKLPEDRWRGH